MVNHTVNLAQKAKIWGLQSLCFHRPLPSLCRPKPSPLGDKLQCLTLFFFFSNVSFCINSVLKDTCDCLLGNLATAGWASRCRE